LNDAALTERVCCWVTLRLFDAVRYGAGALDAMSPKKKSNDKSKAKKRPIGDAVFNGKGWIHGERART